MHGAGRARAGAAALVAVVNYPGLGQGTCALCRQPISGGSTRGMGTGAGDGRDGHFAHEHCYERLAACPHITVAILCGNQAGTMRVGARHSQTGAMWWCVGCGTLFEDDRATRRIATPTREIKE